MSGFSSGVAEPGLCLAIERRAAVPALGGAEHEDDVLITADGCERLTACLPCRRRIGLRHINMFWSLAQTRVAITDWRAGLRPPPAHSAR
jgi:hypothetical protein